MRYSINEDNVVWRKINDEIMLLDLNSGHYYGLNPVGSIVWSKLVEGKSVDDVIGKIVSTYDIAEKEAKKDVDALLATLSQEGLISAQY